MNRYCKKYLSNLEGQTIDFGSGGDPSYHKYFSAHSKIVKTDFDINKKVDELVDLNKRLNWGNNTFDFAILFNTLYILEDPLSSLKEINRVMKPKGSFFLTAPLVFNEDPEPVDYWRFTSQGIKKLLEEAGFREINLYKIGERFSSAISLANPFRKLKYLNLIFYPVALFLDWALPNKIKEKYPCPLGYFIICKK